MPSPSTPAVSKLIPRLRFKVKHEPRKATNYKEGPRGLEGRLVKLSGYVTALFKKERIELRNPLALETRGYAERLIAEAIMYGDAHKPTMELADFWLQEKQLIHKLFKVLVPRYQFYTTTYTQMYYAPSILDQSVEFKQMILELKGNPFPPVVPEKVSRHNQLHNILLAGAREHFYKEQNSFKHPVINTPARTEVETAETEQLETDPQSNNEIEKK